MILPEWLFQDFVENKIKKIHNPKPLRQIARDNIRLVDKQLSKKLVKKMLNSYYFIDRNFKVGFRINLDSHHISHATSKLTVDPIFQSLQLKVFLLIKS